MIKKIFDNCKYRIFYSLTFFSHYTLSAKNRWPFDDDIIELGNVLNRYQFQTLISPLLILAMTCLGLCLSTVHPSERQVPRTCLTVPWKLLDIDFSSRTLAIFLICSNVRLPLWVTFLTFFLSLS